MRSQVGAQPGRIDSRSEERPDVSTVIRDPQVCGGEPVLAGTRLPISTLVDYARHYGWEGLTELYPYLTASQLQCARSYYEDNLLEVDELIRDHEREYERLLQQSSHSR